MSYPPPPGLSSGAHSSLPPRPPPPAKSGAGRGGRHGSSQPAPFTGFTPRAVAAQRSSGASSTIAAAPTPPGGAGSSNSYGGLSTGSPATGANASYQSASTAYSPPSGASYENYAAPPQIRNPFAPPGAASSRPAPAPYDPEMEAQIAQWQSAYAPRDERRGVASGSAAAAAAARVGPGDGPLSTADLHHAAPADSGVASVVTGADGQRKTVVRSGGGNTWQDASLLEWDPAHFRIFVGNLAGEVTDESLLKAFGKYASLQKARVVRDKRTTKSKGYGFVSFADGDDYFQAAREMQGKYIGSHPVLIKKSTTDIKAVTPKDRNQMKRGKGHKGGGSGGGNHGGGSGGGYGSGANTGAGVQKKQKTKGGLKILG